nr:MAG TPA: hypothetical protein [Caudoviricetes sp.]
MAGPVEVRPGKVGMARRSIAARRPGGVCCERQRQCHD